MKNSDNLLNHNKVSSKENDHNSKSDLPKIYSEPFSIKNPNETKEVPSYRQFEKKKSQLFTFEDEILNYPKNYEIPINSRSETSVKNNYDISANYRQDTSKYEPYKPSEIFNGSANGTHCFSNIPTHLSKYMKNETSKENEFQDIQNTYFKSQISNYDPFPNNNTKYESHYRNEAYSNPSTYLKPIELEKTLKIQRIPYKPISNYNSSIKINENAAVYDNVSKYSNLEALSIPFNPKSSESSINNNDIGHSKISYQEIRPYYYDNIYNEKTKSEISNTIKTSSSEENPIKRVIIDNTIKKTKRKLPNPFLYIPKSDENFSEKKAQETPRCIFLNKGRITPKSNTNANVFFKSKAQNDLPINNPSYFENACEINNDNLSHNSFYPAKLFDSKYFSSTNYYELNKPIELTTYQMDLGEEEPKEQKESFTSYNPKEFILEEKIKNISQCSKKNAENMEIYKPILKNVISLPPLFSKDKKTSVNREIQERSSIADTLEKALEILNETANNVYTKNVKPERENHLKSEEKITENELKHVKKENESPSHNTNIQENTNDLEEVSNLVSNQSKKHKILRSNTNNIPNDKNWGDFPCVRSLSSICTNSNSQISKEDLRKQIKFEKPLLQEKNEEISIQKELSMDDLPSISSPENKNKVSHQDQSKIKPTPCEENLEIELKRNSKSLNFNPFKFESLENAPSIIEITNQKDQCELGSQSDLEELQENQKILNLGEKILKMQTLDIYKFEKLKVPKTYSSKNFRSLSAFNKNSQLHLEMGGLDYLDEINNKPKSKSECILISNTDSFKNSVDELSESDKGITDQRTLSIDEGKIILFEEANYSFQAEILSQIDEENDGKSKKVKFEVKKRIKGNYFKKIKENMRKRREKIFVNQKEEKNEKMDKTEKNKGNYFQKLKEKKRKQKYENNQFEEKEKSDINLKKWSGFQTYRKMKVNNGFYQNFSLFKNKLKLQDEIFVEKKGRNNYFKKLKNQNKEKKANKFKVIEETHENLKSNKKEEIQINKKLGYFSQLRKKKHQKKQAQSENAYPELVTINYAKWDKFVFLTQKKKQKGNFFQNEKRKTILAYNEKKSKYN